MIKGSIVIFSVAGIVGITLAALGYRFFISFFSGMGVMLVGILIEFIIIKIMKNNKKKERNTVDF
ncbi:MAG: hypothetical protein HeimAB125_22350 [Candidatus Heimdallarchaeota archaeon AB_125]|nr:MAG: hypothetical protein HeimAB125_22350 [Candidatus Heimdallarchaeota archaeon AB_125]